MCKCGQICRDTMEAELTGFGRGVRGVKIGPVTAMLQLLPTWNWERKLSSRAKEADRLCIPVKRASKFEIRWEMRTRSEGKPVTPDHPLRLCGESATMAGWVYLGAYRQRAHVSLF